MSRTFSPAILSPRVGPRFPDPMLSDPHGLLAVGGSLSPDWLLAAYDRGIFPWYEEGMPPLWWSPDPRAVLDITCLHVSRSMDRLIRRGRFHVTFNRAFPSVVRACGESRDEGTWILPEMLEAYVRLHELGHAHSFEVWEGDRLAGGLYGVQRGALFAAESMFHRTTDASKLALITCVRSLFRAGIRLFDVQFLTSHLMSLGAYEIPRCEYLCRLSIARAESPDLAGFSVDPGA